MRKEFVYSVMALGAIPIAVNAADVQTCDVQASTDGSKVTYPVGKLVPGSYTFSAKLTSKVYGVQVKIAGKTVDVASANNPTDPNVTVNFTLNAETDVELTLESTDPGEAGAGFTVAEAKVILNFDLATAKQEWADAIGLLKTNNVPSYDYDDDEETADKKAADDLITELNAIADTYEQYVAQKLYQSASVPKGKIAALADTIAAHQNKQAYSNVNAAITSIKAKYNTAIAELEQALVGVAAYLLDDAKKDLNDNINVKITEATQASYASYDAGTAVADETTNKGKIPTETAINNIVNNWKGQATTNINKYNDLHAIVTDLQGQLDAIAPVEAIASQFTTEKAEAQAAINAVDTDVEGAKNSAAQLSLDVTAKKNTAQGKITTLAGKVTTANAEYAANQATLTKINTLQTNLNNAKTAVDALRSTDGKYEAKNYWGAYVDDIQKDINDRKAAAKKAYETDHNAVSYDVKDGDVQAKIDIYAGTTEPAADGKPKQAVDKYNALQTAMAGYQTDLNAARDQVKDLAVYTAPDYDYETKLDLIQKRINDIKKAITAAQEKVGEAHCAAMLAIGADAAITNDIANLLSTVQADQNEYDANELANGLTTLKGKIDIFAAKDASKLGADVAAFQSVESDITGAYNDVVNAKNAIDANSETVSYDSKVNKDVSGWNTAFVNPGYYANYQNQTINGLQMVEHWCASSDKDRSTGDVLYQTITGLNNGVYTLKAYVNAVDQSSTNIDKEDIAFAFANDKKVAVKVTGGATNTVYTIENIAVTDGTLRWGINKAKGGTNWHSIQIESLKANTASLIQNWGAKVADLNTQQTALEKFAADIEAKVTANGNKKSGLAASIGSNTDSPKTGLWKAIDDFKTQYKIGTDDTTLGNRGKAGGAVTTEVGQIEDALGKLQISNDGFDPTAVTNVDKTDKVSKEAAAWGGSVPPFGDQTIVEKYETTTENIGNIMSQKVTGLDNGIYDVTLRANANFTPNRGFDGLSGDATDVAYIYANDIKLFITAKKDGGIDGEYTISNVLVTDGTLNLGMAKAKPGTNWHTIQIKSLKYHENDQAATYNNTDEAAPGLNDKFTALSNQLTALQNAAPGIKTAVKDNATTYQAVNTAMAGLKTYLTDKLKNDANVNLIIKADGSFSGSAKMTVYTTNDFVLYRTGLDKDYPTVRGELLADTVAMRAAIEAAFANETLKAEWTNNDAITVVTEDDPATPEVNEASSTTYSITTLKAAIDAIRSKAETEQANWYGYRKIRSAGSNDIGTTEKVNDTFFTNSFTAARTDLATKAGAGAADYYLGLVGNGAEITGSYEDDLAAIRLAMFNSLKARTAVADQAGHIANLKALKAKIDAVQADAAANLAKYNDQVTAYTETQTLWNDTYTQIAATDLSSKVQDWLNELDAIQVTLTACTDSVEDNYKVGKSVAEAKDFAAIKNAINDVKARQNASYSEYVAADNKAAHERFMGTKTTKGAIQLATEAYQTAVQERAKYSATNDDIKSAIETAAATLDAALYSCPTDIANLTKAENDAFAAVVSPEVFSVDTYNTQANTIEQNITTALNTFKAAVKTAIKDNVWDPKKTEYTGKLSAAKDAINAYDADAKKDAFKDVETLIADGEKAMNEWTLAGVEAAIKALDDINEGIDKMLAADKDAAAAKDITKRIGAADTKYTEVKTYINGKTIAVDVNNVKATKLAALEAAYDDKNEATQTDVAYAKSLAKTFANRNAAAAILDGFLTLADGCKNDVKTAVDNDVVNTTAYNEMVAAISPIKDKLAEAKGKVASYKYEPSFATIEQNLEDIKTDVEQAKSTGTAKSYQDNTFDVSGFVADIEAVVNAAFYTEKTGLSADITELKNQYNAYVAAKGLGETATAYKKDIDDLEAAVAAIAIEDLDKPTDGIQYDEILAATAKLVKLQNDIADKETELLAANASTANADVYADFNTQLNDLADTASYDDNEWIGKQTVGGQKISEAIAEIKGQITTVKGEIESNKDNISFFKDQYQGKINAIKNALTPVANAIATKQAQFTANADAFTTLFAAITTLQGKVDAAKTKVSAYEYNGDEYNFISLIERYNNQEELIGGIQKDINDKKQWLEGQNTAVALTATSNLGTLETDVNAAVQNYLDRSAYSELNSQRVALSNKLTNAIDAKYKTETYSNALWNRLITEKAGINGEINKLAYELRNSYNTWKTTPYADYSSYSYDLDEHNNRIAKPRTSDADYADQMQTVAAIAQKISDLADAVDNIGKLGDVNQDGKVNVLDYQKVLNMILDPTLQPAEGSDQFFNTDVNENEVIEVGDLTSIVNYILYQNWNGHAAAPAARGEKMEGESLSMTQGTNRIAINLANVTDYTAFQMDLVLPEGMKLVGAELSNRASESHKLYSRAQLDGSIRMVASSVKGETFSGNEGAVLYIDVEGTGTPELLNILFSDINAVTRSFAIGNDATGIDTVSTFESLKQKVYDLGGRMKNGLKKGINIIRRADGSTGKVVK